MSGFYAAAITRKMAPFASLIFVLTVVLVNEVLTEEGCTPGSTKFDNCNRCICVGDGWACTLMNCPYKSPVISTRAACKGFLCGPDPTKQMFEYCEQMGCPGCDSDCLNG